MEEKELMAKGFEQMVTMNAQLSGMNKQLQQVMVALETIADAASVEKGASLEDLVNTVVEKFKSKSKK